MNMKTGLVPLFFLGTAFLLLLDTAVWAQGGGRGGRRRANWEEDFERAKNKAAKDERFLLLYLHDPDEDDPPTIFNIEDLRDASRSDWVFSREPFEFDNPLREEYGVKRAPTVLGMDEYGNEFDRATRVSSTEIKRLLKNASLSTALGGVDSSGRRGTLFFATIRLDEGVEPDLASLGSGGEDEARPTRRRRRGRRYVFGILRSLLGLDTGAASNFRRGPVRMGGGESLSAGVVGSRVGGGRLYSETVSSLVSRFSFSGGLRLPVDRRTTNRVVVVPPWVDLIAGPSRTCYPSKCDLKGRFHGSSDIDFAPFLLPAGRAGPGGQGDRPFSADLEKVERSERPFRGDRSPDQYAGPANRCLFDLEIEAGAESPFARKIDLRDRSVYRR